MLRTDARRRASLLRRTHPAMTLAPDWSLDSFRASLRPLALRLARDAATGDRRDPRMGTGHGAPARAPHPPAPSGSPTALGCAAGEGDRPRLLRHRQQRRCSGILSAAGRGGAIHSDERCKVAFLNIARGLHCEIAALPKQPRKHAYHPRPATHGTINGLPGYVSINRRKVLRTNDRAARRAFRGDLYRP